MRYSGRAAQPSPPAALGSTHSDPLPARRSRGPCWAAGCESRPRERREPADRPAPAHGVKTPFLFPLPPLPLIRPRTGAEGGGNLFSGKRFQALAACARILLPTNLVWGIISPGGGMRSAATGRWGGKAGPESAPFGRWGRQGLVPVSTLSGDLRSEPALADQMELRMRQGRITAKAGG